MKSVAVIGLGKMGLPLAVKYAETMNVIGVDVDPAVVARVNRGVPTFEEPELAERMRIAHAAQFRLSATDDHMYAVSKADVVVVIVPLVLRRVGGVGSMVEEPDPSILLAATSAFAKAVKPGQLVIFETTMPVGWTREKLWPLIAGQAGHENFLLAFSPERVSSGTVFKDLAKYPKLVGGFDDESRDAAAEFYANALGAQVIKMGSLEAAELAKLAETTYRDVNIAFSNELAGFAEKVGVDLLEVIAACNTQPYSHLHQPGIGVGGHCIPVYPHFLLQTGYFPLVETARFINEEQVPRAIDRIDACLGEEPERRALVLGLTYRSGVNELYHSQGPELVKELVDARWEVEAYDPLASPDLGAATYKWGETSEATVIIVQTDDPKWAELDPKWFPRLSVVFDGRNALRHRRWPAGVRYLGVGLG
jgi:nucleotide sugar dehydrogenase